MKVPLLWLLGLVGLAAIVALALGAFRAEGDDPLDGDDLPQRIRKAGGL